MWAAHREPVDQNQPVDLDEPADKPVDQDESKDEPVD